MDVIRVRDLDVEARVGVTPEERAEPQTLRVQLDLVVDLAPAGASDRLADTVDYGDVAVEAAAVIRGMSPQLLEPIAEAIATAISRRKSVTAVTVEVAKLAPPIPETLGSVAVKIERTFQR
jgi:dihydroneopterin aldolase